METKITVWMHRFDMEEFAPVNIKDELSIDIEFNDKSLSSEALDAVIKGTEKDFIPRFKEKTFSTKWYSDSEKHRNQVLQALTFEQRAFATKIVLEFSGIPGLFYIFRNLRPSSKDVQSGTWTEDESILSTMN